MLSTDPKLRSLRMSIWLAVLLIPFLAHANPVSIKPDSLIAFGVVALAALLIESGVATLSLCSAGVAPLCFLAASFCANAAVFWFAFLPLQGELPLVLLEVGVVLADAAAIKLLSCVPFLQGDSFIGITWRRALLASSLGNATSFFVGVIASGKPWVDSGSPGE